MTPPVALHLAQDPDADSLLSSDPFALLVGMLLDQQFPMERAFAGPYVLAQRLGTPDRLDPAGIAGHDPEDFAAIMSKPPAVHRFPGSMAGRVQALADTVAAPVRRRRCVAVDRRADSGAELLRPAAGAARVRRAEGQDLRRPARQAAGRPAAGVAGGGGRVRRGRQPSVGG